MTIVISDYVLTMISFLIVVLFFFLSLKSAILTLISFIMYADKNKTIGDIRHIYLTMGIFEAFQTVVNLVIFTRIMSMV